MAQHFIISGATGFIGRSLAARLHERGDTVSVLTRSIQHSKHLLPTAVRHILLDESSLPQLVAETEGCDGIINLAGANVGTMRWTEKNKEILRSSRIDTTALIVKALTQAGASQRVLLSASAIGYYGNSGDDVMSEGHPCGAGFLASICTEWERTAMQAEGCARVVMPRIGVVLDPRDGALGKMRIPFMMGVGGPLGSGRQWMSWIHRDDMLRALIHLIDTPQLRGAVNCVAPNPVTMKDFARGVGSALRRPSLAPVPTFMLRMLLGEQHEIVTSGQRVSCHSLLASGFRFSFASLDEALNDLLR